MQSKVFSFNKTLNFRGKLVDLDTPRVMGILNITPDSFFDGGRFADEKKILDQVAKMLEEGADFIDVGGYSTRPGAIDISIDEELGRIKPVIKLILREFPNAMLSIDTFRSDVARTATDLGAVLINDVSGGEADSEMFNTVAAAKVPYCLMHMRGTPQTMTTHTHYENIFNDIIDYFHAKIAALHSLGVTDIVIDPGFGFAKTIAQNFELLHHLDYFHILGCPILAGLSRKSMIWKTIGTDAEGALNGTTSLNTVALLQGASFLRVHDVKPAVESIGLVKKMLTKPASKNH